MADNQNRQSGPRRSRRELTVLADIKLGFRREEAAFLLGSIQIVDEMVRAKWLIPVVNRHRLQIFDRGQISRAWARILNGEIPPRIVRQPRGAWKDCIQEVIRASGSGSPKCPSNTKLNRKT